MARIDKVRSARNYDVREASLNVAVYDEGVPSLAIQSAKEECDINTIVRRFNLTGAMPPNPRIPQYGDFLTVTDYQSALNAVREAGEGFMALPAEVRARFHNDPQEFLDFCSEPLNAAEAEKLGLSIPREAPNMPSGDVPELEEYGDAGVSRRVAGRSSPAGQSGEGSQRERAAARLRPGAQAPRDGGVRRDPSEASEEGRTGHERDDR